MVDLRSFWNSDIYSLYQSSLYTIVAFVSMIKKLTAKAVDEDAAGCPGRGRGGGGGRALACVASVSVRFRRRERGTRVKDRPSRLRS